ncbi:MULTISPECIES: type I secretion system permease/ATPase [unclassified Rhizobacter]|uniref:type I secretion system permease/ATPase n=1 Tax=unclassified Rhizobacter TaxID=2640088 RepID=UPI0006F50237|nr:MULTISPECIES: type I secretion system permease/ATPase [unclassified Rhizobacter]KQU77010.1 ABC transporter [Rhizobacter sp. Root29]KQW14174.1 ABC transporter [Rhizobacter sp. Root1238]KRB18542.1 ABC transporter [Rhizobacter sp. Root16D2]
MTDPRPLPSAAAHAPSDKPAEAAPLRLREDLIHPDPLLDCLVEICRLNGQAASRASLSAGLPLGASGKGRLTIELTERAAARAGMATKLQRLALPRIDAAALPAILILKDNQACVLLRIENGGKAGKVARVLLPETGQGSIVLPVAELQQRYTGVVLFVRPHFRFDARTPEVRAVRQRHWFWGAVLEQRIVYRDVLWAALLVNVFALVFPLFSMNVYDRVVPNNAVETLWALSIGVVLIMCGDLFMRLLRSHFVDEASARIDVQISATLMEKVLGMRLENRPESVGSFASNLRGFEQVRDFIASGTVTALIDLPFALLFVVVLAWISPWLAVPVVAAFTLILVIGYVLQHRLHELSQTTYQASAQRNATLIESLTGIETIKSLGAESVVQAKWERANAFLAVTNVRMRALSSTANYGTNWLSQGVTVAIVIVGVYLISQRELTMGALVASSMLASRALQPAGQIVGLLMQYQGARTAMESLDKIMERPVERPPGENFVQRAQLRGDIEFRNVRFNYPGRQDAALDGISFKIQAGERVALIGRVGSGKSTIERLIMGLYQPNDGAVLLDGIDLRQLDPADVRRNLGYVSQDVTLFYGSLRDNITFGLPYADDSAIVAAAELAGMSGFIDRHPRGFDMTVGERGESLSGGQRQGIGLARAVLHNAPILLLDEPTSAMDFSTEAQITHNIGNFAQNKTVVLVTHRTSLLAMVTRVIVIDGGKIVADGPRDRIMEALQSGRIARAA